MRLPDRPTVRPGALRNGFEPGEDLFDPIESELLHKRSIRGRPGEPERPRFDHSAASSRRHALMDRFPDLHAELRRVFLTMHRRRMLHGCVYEFFLAVSRNGNGTFHLAREFAAIDVLPCHFCLLMFGGALPCFAKYTREIAPNNHKAGVRRRYALSLQPVLAAQSRPRCIGFTSGGCRSVCTSHICERNVPDPALEFACGDRKFLALISLSDR